MRTEAFVALVLLSALGCADKAPPARFPDPPPPQLAKPLPAEAPADAPAEAAESATPSASEAEHDAPDE